MEPKINFRIQGIPHAAVEQEEDDRTRLIRRLVHQVQIHPQTEMHQPPMRRVIATKNSFTEESQQMIHNMGNVDCFGLCENLFQNPVFIQSIVLDRRHRPTVLVGHYLIPTEYTEDGRPRRKFNALTFPCFVIPKRNTPWCSLRES